MIEGCPLESKLVSASTWRLWKRRAGRWSGSAVMHGLGAASLYSGPRRGRRKNRY